MEMKIKKASRLFRLLFLILCFGMLWICYSDAEAAEAPVTASIPVKCTGGNPLETFTVVMEMETNENQNPDRLILRLKADEEGAFTIHYTYPGTYHYTISQTKGTESGTTYDDTVYRVDMYVTEDENGTMYAEPVVYEKGSDEKKAELVFKNTGESSGSKNSSSKSGTSSGSKSAGNVQTGDTSAFALYARLAAGAAVTLLLLAGFRMKKRRG